MDKHNFSTKRMHRPVLFNAVMEGLAIRNGIYIDATFGRGGHSLGLLERLGPDGRLLAIDKDPEAVAIGAKDIFFNDPRFTIVHETFANLENVVRNHGCYGKVDGIVLDLGVSSPQLDNPERGFSFIRDGPLDMRMNLEQDLDATVWLNQASKEDIRYVLRNYSEERYAKRIAEAILKARRERPIVRTLQLSDIVAKALPRYEIKKHPATRTFQAIRIFVNRELDELYKCLPQCLKILAVKGRLCVISFHSLEDRIVKHFIQKESCDFLPRDLPIMANKIKHRLKKIGTLIRPTEMEIMENPRARSARLRIVEKLA